MNPHAVFRSLVLALLLCSLSFARGGGGCFLPDTPVLTSDGTTKQISEVKPGDKLIAYTYEGDILNTTVEEVYTTTADGYYAIRTMHYEVKVTSEHPFYMGDGVFKTAESLQLDDLIFVFNGSGLSRESIVFKEWVEASTTVYNPRTEWPNTYFANFIAVHNKGGGCFVAGTKVETPEGEREIEKLREGDIVISVTPEGRITSTVVRGTFSAKDSTVIVRTSRRSVHATAEHPFMLADGSFRNASELSASDVVVVSEGRRIHWEPVMAVEQGDYGTVYNLEVDEPYTFIADGFVVHNKGGGGGGGTTRAAPGTGQYTVYNTSCGIAKPLKLADGRVLNVSECYYVKYADTLTNIGYAGDLQRCAKSTDDVWRYCALYAKFDTPEMQINCTPMNSCDKMDFIQFENGTKVKVIKPPTILDQVVGFVCGDALICFIIGGIVLFQLLAAGFGKRYGGAISRFIPNPPMQAYLTGGRSDENLDYCYSAPQIDEKSEKTARVLGYLKGIDKTWDPELLKKTAHDTFLKLQECWETREYAPMQPLLMPYLYKQHLDQIDSLKRNHEIDKLENLAVRRIEIVHVKDYLKKDQREFTALIEASVRDYYVDDRTGEFLRGDSEPATFQEFWVFQRQDTKWLLREIEQTRESDALRAENFVEDLTPMQLQNIYGELAGKGGGKKAPWLEEAIGKKGNRVYRLLNFLSSTDKSWDEDFMKESARKAYTAVLTAFEGQDLKDIEQFLMPEAVGYYSDQIEKMKSEKRSVEYRNLCIRKVDVILVKNFSDNNRDEFTVRISAHAQRIDKKDGKTVRKDEYVSPFEEYCTFQKQNGEWTLREIEPPARTRSIIKEENIDEDSSKDQLQWYYTQDRAV